MTESKLNKKILLLLTGNTGLFVRFVYGMVLLFLIGTSIQNHLLLGMVFVFATVGTFISRSCLPEILQEKCSLYWKNKDYRSLRVVVHQMLKRNWIVGGVFTLLVWVFAKDVAGWLLPDVSFFAWILRVTSLLSFVISIVANERAIYRSVQEDAIVCREEVITAILLACMVVVLPLWISQNEEILLLSYVLTLLIIKVLSFAYYMYRNHLHHDFFHEEAFLQKKPAVEIATVLNHTRMRWIVGILSSILSQSVVFVMMYYYFNQQGNSMNDVSNFVGSHIYDLFVYVCLSVCIGIVFAKNFQKQDQSTVLQQRILKVCYYGLPFSLSITFLALPISTILYGSQVNESILFYAGILGFAFCIHVFFYQVFQQLKLYMELITYQVVALILTFVSYQFLMHILGANGVYYVVLIGEGAYIYLCCAKLQNKLEVFHITLGIYLVRIFFAVCAMNGIYALSKYFILPQFQDSLWIYGLITVITAFCGMMVYIFVSHLMGITKSMGDK